jgi:hypothetical protein
MRFKSAFAVTLVAAGIAAALPCPADAESPGRVQQPGYTVLNQPPPAAIDEPVPAAREGYVWVPGYWRWNSKKRTHDWVKGRWIKERRGWHYVPEEWVDIGNRWQFNPGHWARNSPRPIPSDVGDQ